MRIVCTELSWYHVSQGRSRDSLEARQSNLHGLVRSDLVYLSWLTWLVLRNLIHLIYLSWFRRPDDNLQWPGDILEREIANLELYCLLAAQSQRCVILWNRTNKQGRQPKSEPTSIRRTQELRGSNWNNWRVPIAQWRPWCTRGCMSRTCQTTSCS